MEEEEEVETTFNNNESNIMKDKVVKNNKNKVKTSNKQNHESKFRERLGNEAIDYEEEFSEIKKVKT